MRRPLIDELRRLRPDVTDPEDAIAQGRVFVDGGPVTNPSSAVRAGAAIVVRSLARLRGSDKLAAALDAFGVDPSGRTCLDVGAAAGGFTSELLDRGAAKVYAVDVGHGQLLGSLRQDPRVVNLEATNVADLGPGLVPEPVELVTVDVSYLSLSAAVDQLPTIAFAAAAGLLGLVKPMFELRLGSAPTDDPSVHAAIEHARLNIEGAGWSVRAEMVSPVPGAGGAAEGWIWAERDAEIDGPPQAG